METTMTLAVAKIIKGQILILADTRIHDPLLTPRANVTGGMLKTLLLSQSTAVTFTGSPDLAQRTVREFIATNGQTTPFKKTIDYFKAATKGSETEYLLGFAAPGRLFHLSNGHARETRVGAWLGDKDGFERFQAGPTGSPTPFNRTTLIGPDISNEKIVLDQVGRFQGVLEDTKLVRRPHHLRQQ
jgi:hypothetical protein